MPTTLADRVELMEQSPPIEVANVDFDFVNSEETARKFGNLFGYFGRVEKMVGSYTDQLRKMLPSSNEPDSDIGAFLPKWEAHEIPHGKVFEAAQEKLGLKPFADFPTDLPLAARLVGNVTSHSAAAERIVQGVYLSHGARHECLTKQGYRSMSELLEQEGVRGFNETAIKPILRQESLHLGWYVLALREHIKTMSPREIRIVRMLEKLLYWPVGAKQKKNRADFGEVALTLLNGQPASSLSQPIESIVDNVYKDGGSNNTVSARVEACIEEFLKKAA